MISDWYCQNLAVIWRDLCKKASNGSIPVCLLGGVGNLRFAGLIRAKQIAGEHFVSNICQIVCHPIGYNDVSLRLERIQITQHP